MIRESCGVVGIYSTDEVSVSRQIYDCLLALQHRGQESAGIAVFDGALKIYKSMGLASEVFDSDILGRLRGHVGIGHVRYSTAGESILDNSQPYQSSGFSIAMNGNIANYKKLKADLSKEGHTFETTSDFELIAHLLNLGLGENDWFEAIRQAMTRLIGSYTLVILTDGGKLIAARDPLGFRPLCLGRADSQETHIIASESAALDSLEATLIRDVEPGEAIMIDGDGLHSKKLVDAGRHAHCMFEWVYFARADSVIEGISVHGVRERLGQNLAKNHNVGGEAIVTPVPDSGRSAASGFAIVSHMPLLEGFIKNRYLGRTFIMPGQKEREAQLRFNPIKVIVNGKRVVLVDDSIVRGTTLTKLMGLLRRAGAREVHARISCPPLRYPCVFGIDFPTFTELIAHGKTAAEIQEMTGADSLVYQSIDGLVGAIGLPRDQLCLACLTGEYPVGSSDLSWGQLRRACDLGEGVE